MADSVCGGLVALLQGVRELRMSRVNPVTPATDQGDA
jgi:hypothetical protein